MLSTGVPRLFLVFATSVLFLPPRISAQDTIRVESNQVLVPTVVFDRQLYNQLNKIASSSQRFLPSFSLVAKNSKLCESIAVSNLDAKEFHLFEDKDPDDSRRCAPHARKDEIATGRDDSLSLRRWLQRK
jgi:hypothetical protein